MRLPLAIALLASCGAPVAPEPGPGDACARAEQRLVDLSCLEGHGSSGPDGKPGTADDKSFAQLCRQLEEDFPGLAQPDCIVVAEDCTEARMCAGE